MRGAQCLIVLVISAGLAHQPNWRRGLGTTSQCILKSRAADFFLDCCTHVFFLPLLLGEGRDEGLLRDSENLFFMFLCAVCPHPSPLPKGEGTRVNNLRY